MFVYRDALKSDMNSIAKVHTDCFKGYFLTSLGEKLLEKYYAEYFDEGAPFVLALNDGEIIGFCMGYQTGTKARANFEKKYKLQISVKLLGLCLFFNKNAWVRVIKKIKSIIKGFKQNKKKNITIDEKKVDGAVLSICVVEKFRGTGVAKALINIFEDKLKNRRIEKCSLSVLSNNGTARAFYEKMGYSILKEKGDSVVYIKNII